MTERESEILTHLAQKYPSSSQATGGNKMRIKISTAFPHINRRNPDEYESFLEAAEKLEQARIISLVWTGKTKGEELNAILLENPTTLYATLGQTNPSELCADFRLYLEGIAPVRDEPAHDQDGLAQHSHEQVSPERVLHEHFPFIHWLHKNIKPKDFDPIHQEPSAHSFQGLLKIFVALKHIETGKKEAMLPRALSIELFNDSKRLEDLLRLYNPFFSRAKKEDISLPPLELIDRSFPETLIAGKLTLSSHKTELITNNAGFIFGLPFESIMQCTNIKSLSQKNERPKVLGVENKETFYALAKRLVSDTGDNEFAFDALVYVGGHPNRAVLSLFKLFAQSNWSLYHTGDLDIDGILILQELADFATVPIIPWMMDRFIFDQYKDLGRNLDPDMHRRALAIRPETLSLFGLQELADSILSTGIGIEQEIILY